MAAMRWSPRPPVWLGKTIHRGRRKIARAEAPTDRLRCPGAGCPRIQEDQPGILAALEVLVDPLTRGDPTSVLRWTCKSRAKLAATLTEQGWRVSSTTVGRLLNRLGYRLQSVRKRREGTSHPHRNAQFEHINATAEQLLTAGRPVISVDTKKKELVGNFANAGREWQPMGTPTAVRVHDFPTDAQGKAIPYGVHAPPDGLGAPDRALGASDGLLGLPMDASGAGRLNRSSPSCLNRSAQRIDFFHGLLSADRLVGCVPGGGPTAHRRRGRRVTLWVR